VSRSKAVGVQRHAHCLAVGRMICQDRTLDMPGGPQKDCADHACRSGASSIKKESQVFSEDLLEVQPESPVLNVGG